MSNIKHGYPDNPRIIPPVGPPGKRVDQKYVPQLWALEVIDAPGAWLIPLSGPEQTVCIIDQGFDPTHQDLAPTGSFEEIELDPSGDEDGHGTAVGGIIAAAHDTGHGRAGMCPGARVLAFRVGYVWYKDLIVPPSRIGIALDMMAGRMAEAIRLINTEFVKQHNCRILSISKSGPSLGKAFAQELAEKYLQGGVDAFVGQGGLLILGGANEKGVLAAECFPAAVKQISNREDAILVVGSIQAPDALWHGDLEQVYEGQDDVDVYAPGGEKGVLAQEVLDHTHSSAYKEEAGNSLAIPYVAGLAALLLRINPDLDGETVARIISETAENQVDTAGKPIRLINAFAAALKVHNELTPAQPLAGYRVSIPIEFNAGRLVVNGEPIPVSNIGRWVSFCRFTAPLDLDIHARLYKHPDLEADGSNRCYWEGRFRQLLSSALPNSKESAWNHGTVAALRTIRLQGIAARVYYPGKREVVANAGVLLVEKSRGTRFEGRTDHEGYCVIPFGEPGRYVLSVEEDVRYEVELDLSSNLIYEADIVLGEGEAKNKWKSTWAGDVLFQGDAVVFEQKTDVTHEELEELVVWPGHLLPGDLYTATGSIQLTGTSKPIEKEPLIHKVLVRDEYIEDLVYEEGPDGVSDDMLPDLSPVTIRAFSETMCRWQHGFSAEINERLRHWEFGGWEGGFGAHEKEQFVNLPTGLLLASGEDELEIEIPFPSVIRGLLQARFQQEPHEQQRIPLWIDVAVHWCLDYSTVHGPGHEIQIASAQGRIHPASIPYRVEHLSQKPEQWRVVAGPAWGLLEFMTHPKNPLKIEMETLSYPGNQISAIIREPAEGAAVPREFREVWVLSSQGELSLIDLSSALKQQVRDRVEIPTQQPPATPDGLESSLGQLEARQQREWQAAETFTKLQRMGPEEAREHMEMIEERHKRQREELIRSHSS